ncbi:MAG: GNAT family N-acetyltransferase [Akkermansiaceae bacterium]
MLIRQLDSSDASIYQKLRLQALNEYPPAFGSNADEESVKTNIEIEQYLIGTDDRILFGAFIDSTIVGMIRHSLYTGTNEGHRSYIASFYVDPDHRGKGIGRALLKEGIALAEKNENIRRINLTVVSGQASAIRLYESMGFLKCGTDYETFIDNGKFYDEILMTKSLKMN